MEMIENKSTNLDNNTDNKEGPSSTSQIHKTRTFDLPILERKKVLNDHFKRFKNTWLELSTFEIIDTKDCAEKIQSECNKSIQDGYKGIIVKSASSDKSEYKLHSNKYILSISHFL